MPNWNYTRLSEKELKTKKEIKALEKSIKKSEEQFKYLKANLIVERRNVLQLEGKLPHQQVSGKMVGKDDISELKPGHTKGSAQDISDANKQYLHLKKEVVSLHSQIVHDKKVLKQLDPENKIIQKDEAKAASKPAAAKRKANLKH